MQYNIINGAFPVLTLDSDGNPNYHDVLVDLMINKERNISIAQVIGTHRKTLVLTAQPSMHCEHILKHLSSAETHLKHNAFQESKPAIRIITKEECDYIIQHQEPDTKVITPFDHVPEASDFQNQQALVMSFTTFEKLLCWHSHITLEMLHTVDKNPAEATLYSIFDGVDVVIIATPHKEIDKMIEYAQFGFESAPKKKSEVHPAHSVRRGSVAMPTHATANTGAHAHAHSAQTASAKTNTHAHPHAHTSTGAHPEPASTTANATASTKAPHPPHTTSSHTTALPKLPTSPIPIPIPTRIPSAGSARRNSKPDAHLPSIEKTTSQKTDRPDRPPSGHTIPVPKHDSTEFVHKSDNNQHYIAHPHTGVKKAHITLCEFGDNIDPYVQWCKWHSEKVARIRTYDITGYRKDVHYQHKQAL